MFLFIINSSIGGTIVLWPKKPFEVLRRWPIFGDMRGESEEKVFRQGSKSSIDIWEGVVDAMHPREDVS